jgi:glutamate-1-semialdehyde 2,1-aminomutase
MPVGAYGASNKLMSHVAPEGAVYQAGTLSANPVAMAAGYAALKQLLEEDFYENLAQKTASFVESIQNHCDKKEYPVNIVNIGSIFWIAFAQERILRADQIEPASMEKFKILHHELLQRGVYLGPSGYEVGFVSAAHSKDDLNLASKLICECMDIVFS